MRKEEGKFEISRGYFKGGWKALPIIPVQAEVASADVKVAANYPEDLKQILTKVVFTRNKVFQW